MLLYLIYAVVLVIVILIVILVYAYSTQQDAGSKIEARKSKEITKSEPAPFSSKPVLPPTTAAPATASPSPAAPSSALAPLHPHSSPAPARSHSPTPTHTAAAVHVHTQQAPPPGTPEGGRKKGEVIEVSLEKANNAAPSPAKTAVQERFERYLYMISQTILLKRAWPGVRVGGALRCGLYNIIIHTYIHTHLHLTLWRYAEERRKLASIRPSTASLDRRLADADNRRKVFTIL